MSPNEVDTNLFQFHLECYGKAVASVSRNAYRLTITFRMLLQHVKRMTGGRDAFNSF